MPELSGGELTSLVKLAGRGVGYSWGLAEEAGFASSWLCNHGFAGLDVFADLYQEIDKLDLSASRITRSDDVWSAGGPLCPVMAGSALNDHAHLFEIPYKLELHGIVCPLVLFPFLMSTSKICGKPIYLESLDGRICFGNDSLYAESEKSVAVRSLTQASAGVNVLVYSELDASNESTPADKLMNRPMDTTAASPIWQVKSISPRTDIHPVVLKQLRDYAHRTYAPATEQSRLSGAGAGTTDND